MNIRSLCFLAMLAMWASPAHAQNKDQDIIGKNADDFVQAFHKGDAKAVAGFWALEGDYTDKSGRHLKGRDAIEKAFASFFAENPGVKLRIDSDSLRFVTPDVAIEDGTTAVFADGGPPSQARYTIVHVKKDGQWKLGSVRDATYIPATNYEHLRELEWVIGTWTAESDKGDAARVTFAWADNQNFIISTFTHTHKNVTLGGGTQWIGWDPAGKRIRSWTFDSDGGFGEGSWTSAKNQWTNKSEATHRDGKKQTAVNVVTRVDGQTITWQSKNRVLDGTAIPDGQEIKLKRVP